MRRKPVIDQKWNRELSKFFSSSTVNELVENGYSPFVREIIFLSGLDKIIGSKATIGELFQWVYDYLCRNYRNEYIYKSAITKQILLGKHSFDESMLLTELRVGECKADVVVLNGTSTVYEIKSEFDNMDRLTRQLDSYRSVFDHIQVITAMNQVEKVLKKVGSDIGVLLLDESNKITVVQKSKSYKDSVSPNTIFDSLRQSEYTNVIKSRFGMVPNVPNTQVYSVCKKLFAELSPEEAHDQMVSQLKARSDKVVLREFLDSTPECFHAYCMSSGMKIKNRLRFVEVLNMECESVFYSA